MEADHSRHSSRESSVSEGKEGGEGCCLDTDYVAMRNDGVEVARNEAEGIDDEREDE